MIRVTFGITCKNASLTIDKVLELLLLQEGDFEKIFVVVDGGSSDGTLEMVRDILSKSKIQYILESGNYTIPEGRNRVLELAMGINTDYILFIDADVVFRFRNLVQVLLNLAKKLGDKAVISVRYKCLHFSNPLDAEKFMDTVAKKNEYLENSGYNIRAIAWSGLGFTLLPREAATIKFDVDMTFDEDTYICLELYRGGFKLYEVSIGEDVAFDINVKASNIYFSMGLRNYLRGIRKKVAMYVYENFDPLFLNFVKNFAANNNKSLYHVFYTTLAILGILTNNQPLLLSAFILILFYILLQFRKSRSPKKILVAWLKFFTYSLILTLLLIPTYLKHRLEYQEIYKTINSLRREVAKVDE